MHARLITAAAVVLAGCALDQGPHLSAPPQFSVTSGTCDTYGNALYANTNWATTVINNQAANIYPCGATINVTVTGGVTVTTDVINSAMEMWNGTLDQYDLPRFGNDVQSSYHVTITETGTGNYLCGTTSIPSASITITHTSTPTNCPGPPGALPYTAHPLSQAAQLVAHELGHALGFKSHLISASQSQIDQDTIVGDCMMVVPTILNSTPCDHERQIIYYQYALRGTDILTDRGFISGVQVQPTSLLLDANESATVTATNVEVHTGNHPEGTLVTPAGQDVIAWTFNSLNPANSFSITGTTATTATVRSDIVPATGTLEATVTSSAVYNILWPFNAGEYDGRVSLANKPPVAAPSGLTVGTVTASTAGLSWTNGDAAAQTTVQKRLTGAGSWTTETTVAAGVTSSSLTNLTACTGYDASVFHVRNGLPSASATASGIHTPAASGLCLPTQFTVISCSDSLFGGKWYLYVNTTWVRNEYGSPTTWEIGSNTTNNPGGASVIQSAAYHAGSPDGSATLGPYLETSTTPRYFWVRNKVGAAVSGWTALDANPIRPNIGCPA